MQDIDFSYQCYADSIELGDRLFRRYFVEPQVTTLHGIRTLKKVLARSKNPQALRDVRRRIIANDLKYQAWQKIILLTVIKRRLKELQEGA